MAVTLKDVAERAGVSRSAVSRAFTEGASVSAETREKVLRAAAELGYRPNVLASSLTTGRTKLVGLVSNNFRNPVFLQVFDHMTRGLQDRGLRPLLVNLSDETDPGHSVDLLRQYSADAVIVASSTLPVSFARSFHDAGLPVVHVFGRHVRAPTVNVVGIDNIVAGRMAATTLIDRGYKRIAIMAGPEGATSTQDRVRGFREVVGISRDVEATVSYASAYSFDAGRAEMLRLLEGDRAEAYFCGDDVLSIGALSAAQTKGLKVPDDLGILGLNDMDMARWENFDLTTIAFPLAEIVEASVDLVAQMLDDPDIPAQSRLFEMKLVERGTLRKA